MGRPDSERRSAGVFRFVRFLRCFRFLARRPYFLAVSGRGFLYKIFLEIFSTHGKASGRRMIMPSGGPLFYT